MDKNQHYLQMTVDIVASHASMNKLGQSELLSELDLVYKKLINLAGGEGIDAAIGAEVPEAEQKMKPAVPLDAAFGAEKVFCMVCGKGMKTLKRHLSTAHDMKPGQYRKAFDIPPGTILVAKQYSAERKKMAKKLKLADQLAVARAAKAAKRKKSK